jgi:hypothetical protein
VKDVALFRSERGGGNDDAVEGEQRQPFRVEHIQRFVQRVDHVHGVRWVDLGSGSVQEFEFL